jgi:hypothetical protein
MTFITAHNRIFFTAHNGPFGLCAPGLLPRFLPTIYRRANVVSGFRQHTSRLDV